MILSHDFLKQIIPQPELFELRHVLAIPKEDIEARHDYMLSVIKDRVNNADVYEREYFSKYPHYGYSRRKIGFSIDNLWEIKKKKYFPGRRRIMNSSTECKHRPVHEVENKLYPDYDDGLFEHGRASQGYIAMWPRGTHTKMIRALHHNMPINTKRL